MAYLISRLLYQNLNLSIRSKIGVPSRPYENGGRPEDRPPPQEGNPSNFPAYTANSHASLLLSPFGVMTER